jgi:hypothetical protein
MNGNDNLKGGPVKKTILAVLMILTIATPCFAQDEKPDKPFSIEGTQWQSLPIGMIIFPITAVGPIDPYEVGFYDGKVYFHGYIYGGFQYEPADEKRSFYMDMLVASIFMYSGRNCQMSDGCWDYIVFGIMQPIGVGVMTTSNGVPIPDSVGAAILVKTNDNWVPEEDVSRIYPNKGEQGTTLTNVEFTGLNTTFQDNPPVEIGFIPSEGLTVSDINVMSNTVIEFDLEITVDAPTGWRRIIVMYDDGNKLLEKDYAFEVSEKSN